MPKLIGHQKPPTRIIGSILPDSTIAITPEWGQYYEFGTIILSTKLWVHTVILRRVNFNNEQEYFKEIRRYLDEWYQLVNGIFSRELIKALGVESEIDKILSESQK